MTAVIHRVRSRGIIVTFSKPYGEWGDNSIDRVLPASALDEQLHSATTLGRPGQGYRSGDKHKAGALRDRAAVSKAGASA